MSRPDFLFYIATIAQITERMFDENACDILKNSNNAITYATSNQTVSKFDH